MFGRDFFKWLNFVIQILRMLAKNFGSAEEKEAAEESEARSKEPTSNHAC